jgi:ankyrin repeat protein
MQKTTAVAKLILECPRVDVAVVSSDGRTALAYAAPCASVDMVLLLLETGKFDPTHKDSYGKTALDWALMNPHPQVAKALRDAMPKSERPFS